MFGVLEAASSIMAAVEERRERVVHDIKELVSSKLGQAWSIW